MIHITMSLGHQRNKRRHQAVSHNIRSTEPPTFPHRPPAPQPRQPQNARTPGTLPGAEPHAQSTSNPQDRWEPGER